jgi:hypothetical protein
MADPTTAAAAPGGTGRSMADPLISDVRVEEIRLHVERGCSCASNVAAELIPETDRLREHNAYLSDLFYGITRYFGHLCEEHAAIPLTERDLSRYEVPACEGCKDDDIRALVAGNVEAATMARRYRECGARNIELMIENHRLRELLGEPLPRPGAHSAGEGER